MTNNDELAMESERIIDDMKRRHKDIQIYAPIMTWSEFETLLAERDADKKRIAELNRDVDASNARVDTKCAQLCNQDEEIEMLRLRIAELQTVSTAAEKLVRCKGRYHSEQNYRALAALFGVKTPDLPTMEKESLKLELIVPPRRCFDYAALAVQERDEQWHKALHDACKRNGFKMKVGE